MTILQGLFLMIAVFIVGFVGSAVISGVIEGVKRGRREAQMRDTPTDTNWPPAPGTRRDDA